MAELTAPNSFHAYKGHLLAFAEARNNSGCNDYTNISIVVRRSTDGGNTFGNIVEVATYVGDGGVGVDPDKRVGNPSPVVDEDTGRVFVLFVSSLLDAKAGRSASNLVHHACAVVVHCTVLMLYITLMCLSYARSPTVAALIAVTNQPTNQPTDQPTVRCGAVRWCAADTCTTHAIT